MVEPPTHNKDTSCQKGPPESTVLNQVGRSSLSSSRSRVGCGTHGTRQRGGGPYQPDKVSYQLKSLTHATQKGLVQHFLSASGTSGAFSAWPKRRDPQFRGNENGPQSCQEGRGLCRHATLRHLGSRQALRRTRLRLPPRDWAGENPPPPPTCARNHKSNRRRQWQRPQQEKQPRNEAARKQE